MNDAVFVNVVRRSLAVLATFLGILSGCARHPAAGQSGVADPALPRATLAAVNLSDPIRPIPGAVPIVLKAARNEWTSFALEVSNVYASSPVSLHVAATPAAGNPLSATNLQAFQILSMPVEVNPDYVRHTGLNSASRNLPRAMLPATMTSGEVNLASLRDPTQPTNAAAHPNGDSVLLWIDVHVPPDTPPGTYEAFCELRDSQGRTGTIVPLQLTVYDFALSAERHLAIVGQLNWDRLARVYPQWFGDTITPSLINRREERYGHTVATLDELISLAQENRTSLIVPGLRPTVKWPAGAPPEIDWREYDALVAPWLSGQAFADHVPLGYWPLPSAQSLSRFDLNSRLAYWSQATSHFDRLGWINASAAALPPAANESESPALAAEALEILMRDPKVRVTLPLGDDQLSQPALLEPRNLNRLLTTAPGLVSTASSESGIGADVRRRPHWLRTDMSGLVPTSGAGGDERDVRVWAWLAFLRQAELIVWDQSLPATDGPKAPADADEMVWFYPGEWFGVDRPVPTTQLKWLRRAEQDYEYLWLAKQRGEVINALQLARLITKPLEVTPGQMADPVYSLMSGTTNQEAWDRAQELLAETVLLRKPGEPVDENLQRALNIQTLQWAEPQERPVVIGRRTQWELTGPRTQPSGRAYGNWLTLNFGVDVYNASDTTPAQNQLRWDAPPQDSGWEVRPREPVEVPRLLTYHVQPVAIRARFNLDRLTPASRQPLGLTFVSGFSGTSYRFPVRLPVAATDRREGPIKIDGNLTDWTDADCIENRPLLLMLNRPNLQTAQLQPAQMPARIYSCWGRENLYFAFALEGVTPEPGQAHNDVYYEARRAWGEDLAEALIQPVFADNSTGPVLHVVFKPNGALWVERKSRDARASNAWQPIEVGGIRYATTTSSDGRWHGEAAIPWKLVAGRDSNAIPSLLRFNFSQHRNANCESASWCGPVDHGRDDQLMGVLFVRTPRG
jgi:hypothetical protein